MINKTPILLCLLTLPLWSWRCGVSCNGGEVVDDPDNPPHVVKVPQKQLVPFLKKNCLRCHKNEEKNGDFSLEELTWSIATDAHAESWQDVLDVLNSGEMPPESERQPKENDLLKALATLTKTLTDARAALSDSGAAVPIRRLNKREYINTMHHLFGLNLNEAAIPGDLRGEHFDTLGETQFFGTGDFESFLTLGTDISRLGLRWSGRPFGKLETHRIEPETINRGRIEKLAGYSTLPGAAEGRYLAPGQRELRSIGLQIGDDPRAFYRVKVHGGLAENGHPLRRAIVVNQASGTLGIPGTEFGVLQICGTLKKAQTVQIEIPRRALGLDGRRTGFSLSESNPRVNTRGFRRFQNQIGDKDQFGPIWIDWIETEGPIYPTPRSVLGELIAANRADGSGEIKSMKGIDVKRWLTDFATEAFRRQSPTPQYIDALVDHYESSRKLGGSDVNAFAETLGIILTSPGFLYLKEETKRASSRQLTARSLATRLAYFLWSAPPDEELYRLAKSRSLLKPNTLEAQVNRMLDDEKADSFFTGFMSQWAELERLNGVSVNVKDYPRYSVGYQLSIAREPIEYFKVMVRENLSVDQLIDSDFAVINAFLADHYDLPKGDYSNKFKKVSLAEGSPRGGMITQAGFLTMGSDGHRTSPVIRGALLMDKLLNQPPPPPPPNVPELAEASEVPVSNRQIVELHQKQTACASCHKRIDPIGFGLENFDVVGRWRENETVGNRKIPIRPEATLVTGVKFSGLQELKELLNSQRHRLAEGIIESMLAYGLGRNHSFSDQNAVAEILSETRDDNFLMRDLIIGIVKSEPFQSK